MSGVALVAHHERSTARAHAIFAAAWCSERGYDFWMPAPDADALGLGEHRSDRPVAEADVVLSLGGDGTMLRSVGLLDGAVTPLLGVNLGSLGYLTEVEPDDLGDALVKFFAGPQTGEWSIDDRMMLDVSVNGVRAGRALNEAVVEKSESGHTVRLLAR
ncbi:MAG: NAD+ kinase, partial [Ilumatobacter sp.]